MKIEFEFDIEDWMEFQRNYLVKSNQFKRLKIFIALSLPIFFSILIIYDITRNEFNLLSLVIYAVGSVFWGIFYPKRFTERTLSSMRKMIEEGNNSSILGHHEIVFNYDMIIYKMPELEQKINWKAIIQLEESETHYFLYNTTISAIIIPKKKIDVDLVELEKMLRANILKEENKNT